MSRKRLFGIVLLSLIFIQFVFSQEAKIDIEHAGFGETMKDVYFTVHNTGEIPITDVQISVDGEEYEIVRGISSPRKGFETILYLEPGNHLIEVETEEGAYDSLEINVGSETERNFVPPKEFNLFTEKHMTNTAVVALVIILLIAVWVITRKRKI